MKSIKLTILVLSIAVTVVFPVFAINGQDNTVIKDIPFQDTLGEIADSLNKINETEYRTYVEYLAYNITQRPWNTDNNKKAQDWIMDTLRVQGNRRITIEIIGEYDSILAKLPSNNPTSSFYPAIVLSAHFDSVSASPGTDDNGSGTALLLFMAKLLSSFEYKFNFDIYFAFANAEEFGLLGSQEIATRLLLQQQLVDIVINADMILYGPPKLHYNEQGDFLDGEYQAKQLEFLSQSYFSGEVSATNSLAGWTQSDHYSYWAKGFPAITAFERDIFSNPYYHSGSDLPDAEGYNYSYPVEIAKAITLYIADMSRALESDENFHYYQFPKVEANKKINYMAREDTTIMIEIACEDSCSFKLGSDTYEFEAKQTFYINSRIKKGITILVVNQDAKLSIFSGDDDDLDNTIDFLEIVLVDFFFDEIDLMNYDNIYRPPKQEIPTTTISSSVSSVSSLTQPTQSASNPKTQNLSISIFIVGLGIITIMKVSRKRKN